MQETSMLIRDRNNIELTLCRAKSIRRRVVIKRTIIVKPSFQGRVISMMTRPLVWFFWSCAIIGWMIPQTARAQDTADETAAWGLWTEVVGQLKSKYLEPLTETQITRDALDLLAKHLTSNAGPPYVIPENLGDTDEEVQRKFRELIREQLGKGGRRQTATGLVEKALSLYCEKKLLYSEYTTSVDVQTLKTLPNASLGMVVEADGRGKFLARPSKDGAADRAGVRFGDELIAVDGKTINGLSKIQVSKQLRGAEGSLAKVQFRRQDGRQLEVTIRREKRIPRAVEVEIDPLLPARIIRIPHFNSADILVDLEAALREIPAKCHLTLDFRGNEGGDLTMAIDAAGMLGLGKATVAKLISRAGSQDLASSKDAIYTPKQLLILQDSHTASGAELITAALLEFLPKGTVTIAGDRSYGKVYSQETVTTNLGGSLRVTDSKLTTAGGMSWEKGISITP
jgi:C-terminal peptidase prc